MDVVSMAFKWFIIIGLLKGLALLKKFSLTSTIQGKEESGRILYVKVTYISVEGCFNASKWWSTGHQKNQLYCLSYAGNRWLLHKMNLKFQMLIELFSWSSSARWMNLRVLDRKEGKKFIYFINWKPIGEWRFSFVFLQEKGLRNKWRKWS